MQLERTRHGEQQQQRRATLPLMEWMLMTHGTHVRSQGADLIFLDKAARKRIQREVGGKRGMRVFDRYMNSYLVIGDDGRVVTTGYRTRRIKRR